MKAKKRINNIAYHRCVPSKIVKKSFEAAAIRKSIEFLFALPSINRHDHSEYKNHKWALVHICLSYSFFLSYFSSISFLCLFSFTGVYWTLQHIRYVAMLFLFALSPFLYESSDILFGNVPFNLVCVCEHSISI